MVLVDDVRRLCARVVSMEFTTRPANESEAELVAKLNSVVQQLHHEQRPDWFKPPDPSAVLPIVRGWLSTEAAAVFVAQDAAGELVGYAVGVRHERPDNALVYGADIVELDQVVVVESARRAGVGRSLCAAVLDWADSLGVDRVELSTWSFNDSAASVFDGLGFTPTVRRMSRSLADAD